MTFWGGGFPSLTPRRSAYGTNTSEYTVTLQQNAQLCIHLENYKCKWIIIIIVY